MTELVQCLPKAWYDIKRKRPKGKLLRFPRWQALVDCIETVSARAA